MRPELICGECSECCKGPHREAEINEPGYITYERDGKTYLGRKENGDCVYFDGKCTIYPNRPQICRDFDCRDYIDEDWFPKRMQIQAILRLE